MKGENAPDAIATYRTETTANADAVSRVSERLRRSIAEQEAIHEGLRSLPGASADAAARVQARLQIGQSPRPTWRRWALPAGVAVLGGFAAAYLMLSDPGPTKVQQSPLMAQPNPPETSPQMAPPSVALPVPPGPREEPRRLVERNPLEVEVEGVRVFGSVDERGARASLANLNKTWRRCLQKANGKDLSVQMAIDGRGDVKAFKVQGAGGAAFQACSAKAVLVTTFRTKKQSVAGVEEPVARSGIVRFRVKRID